LPVFKVLDFPYCKVIQMDPWNSPEHRYFIAYRAEGTFRQVIGLPVIDEFATFSSPIFFAPDSILGKIYNVGISLGHLRDPEMGIDLGWPPLCIGVEGLNTNIPHDFESQILNRIKQFDDSDLKQNPDEKNLVEGHQLQRTRIGNVDVFATNAPLLPKQLKQICQLSSNPFSIAFSVGNRITAQENGAALTVEAVSEFSLRTILDAFQKL
jgi:hypothetical protein